MAIASVISPAGALNISGITANPAITTGDKMLYYDASAGANRSLDYADLSAAVLSGTTTWKGFGAEKLLVRTALPGSLDVVPTVYASFDKLVVEDGSGLVKRVTSPSVISAAVSGAHGAGALDTGALASNTWYYVWVIAGVSTVALMVSASATAPTMPAGYTFKALVGAVRSNASSTFVSFYQVGNRVFSSYNNTDNRVSQVSSMTTSVQTASPYDISAVVPPLARMWHPYVVFNSGAAADSVITVVGFVSSSAVGGVPPPFYVCRPSGLVNTVSVVSAIGTVALTTAQSVVLRYFAGASTSQVTDIYSGGFSF